MVMVKRKGRCLPEVYIRSQSALDEVVVFYSGIVQSHCRLQELVLASSTHGERQLGDGGKCERALVHFKHLICYFPDDERAGIGLAVRHKVSESY